MSNKTFHDFAYLACLLTAAITAGCSSQPKTAEPVSDSSTQKSAAIVDGSEPSQEQRETMLAAKDLLFGKLSGRLMQVMGEQGPAAAIAVCQKEAKQIAADVGEQQQLMIGRTGVRLRNPTNQPPDWAKSLTENRTDTPTFVSLTNGNAAALLPIKLQVQCLMCHGPKEQIDPGVLEQLQKLYPDDQATGFQEGELRGWFWIEMPTEESAETSR